MIISAHAVDQYLERLLNISRDQAGESVIDFVSSQIQLTVHSPEITYLNKEFEVFEDEENSIPIHIRNMCAVPVKLNINKYGERVYIVPTVYNAKTFLRKFESHEQPEIRG